ncbi:MAG: biotin/lipoyl-binding protein, partial [Acidobacteriota bacterium]
MNQTIFRANSGQIWQALTTLVVWSMLVTLCGCAKKEEKTHQETVPVTVASVTQRDFPIDVHANGNVAPYTSVAIRALVGGQLTRVSFREGDDVRKGSPLFTIDPRPFQAALAQAQANLNRDQAQLRNAETNARRYAGLVSKD